MRTQLGLLLACVALIALSFGCEAKKEEAGTEPGAQNSGAAKKAPEKSPGDLASDWAGAVCGDYRVCYTEFEWNGAFDGVIEAEVAPDGTVMSASYAGSAPPPLQACLTDRVKAKTLDGYQAYEGMTLSAKCTFSGQLTGGTVMEMVDWRGTWIEAPAAPPAEAAPAASPDATGGADVSEPAPDTTAPEADAAEPAATE